MKASRSSRAMERMRGRGKNVGEFLRVDGVSKCLLGDARQQREEVQEGERDTQLYYYSHFPQPQAPAAHPQSAHEQPSVPQPGILTIKSGVVLVLGKVLCCVVVE